MNKTIEYYNKNAESFVAGTLGADMSDCRERFLKYVPDGGFILDAGCGSGRDSEAFMKAGYQVSAFDASAEICRLASARLRIPVTCTRFEDLSGSAQYDGIWACASLLHVKASDLPDVIGRLRNLLKPEGVLYASFKEGSGEREKDGRFFTDLELDECERLFSAAGFHALELFESGDVREGRSSERWVNIIAQKR